MLSKQFKRYQKVKFDIDQYNALKAEFNTITSELEDYGEMVRIMFTVKPGITGPWQVAGRGELSFKERADLNAEYIEHWTLARDISILFKTAFQLLFNKRGAY